MAAFKQAIEKVIANEGGYSNDPADNGGETYKGISRKNFPAWKGWAIIDCLKSQLGFPGNIDHFGDINVMVSEFYYNEFWLKINGNQYKWQPVAESVFDFAVNAGCGTSITMAQRVAGVKVDGIIGTGTLAAINEMEPRLFNALFTIEKCRWYCSIARNHPPQGKYLRGWIERAIRDVK